MKDPVMKQHVTILVAALALAACAAPGSTGYAPPPSAAPVVEVLTDGNGMTLYYFDRDEMGSGKSACNGPCAAAWPPQAAGDDSTPFGQYTIIKREDGTKQWAYKGRPLYRWAKDTKPGERTGDNVNNVWHIVTP
jgi:predicted lipoprotein with Yx(FWY)xxD motif